MKKLAMKMLSLLLVLSLLLPTCVFAQPGQDGDGTPGTQGATMEDADTPTGGGNGDENADAPTGGGSGDEDADAPTGGGSGDGDTKDVNGGSVTQSTTSEKTTTFTEGEDGDTPTEEPTVATVSIAVAAEDDGISQEELLEGYLYSISGLYGEGAAVFRAPSAPLPEVAQDVYNALAPEIENVASGTRNSAKFVISNTWTKPKVDWGITGEVISGGAVTAEASAAIREKINMDALLHRLLSTMPYKLYWFDKTDGGLAMEYGISVDSTGNSVTVQDMVVYMTVAGDYTDGTTSTGGTTPSKTYKTGVDTGKTGATTAAVNNAKNIVSANSTKRDYEKLKVYLSEICNRVEYNHAAAGSSWSGGYGDPWQLIYVFDGIDTTNVVCEGYAKAFKYLCDLTWTTSPAVECYLVTGTMSGGTGAGGTGAGNHMWNVVHIGGKNYLVDVTNCDTGTIGATDKLFLCGVEGQVNGESYHVTIGSSAISYSYDAATKGNYTTDELTLSGVKYEEPAMPALGGTVTITGASSPNPKISDTLTANTGSLVYNGATGGTLSYQWKAGVENVGTGNTYTVKAADYGKTITVTVTNSNNSGSVTSAPTAAVVKKDNTTVPTAPTVKDATAEGFTYTAIAGQQYAISTNSGSPADSEWGAVVTTDGDVVVTGKSANTEYYIYTRIAETEEAYASAASTGTPVKTLMSALPSHFYCATHEAVYTGSANGATVTSSVHSSSDFTLKYDGASTAPTNVGKYTLTAEVKAHGSFAATTVNLGTWEIKPKTIDVTWGSTTLTYTGSAQAPAISSTSGAVSGENVSVGVKEVTKKTDASPAGSTYTAEAEILSVTGGQAKADNYVISSTTKTKTYTINAATITVGTDAFKDYTGVYDGNPHSIEVDTSKITTVNNQTITIKYGTASGTYDLGAAPTATNVSDSKTVYWQITAPNHEVATGTAMITINKANATITATTPREIVKNGVAEDISNWATCDSGAALTYTLVGSPSGIAFDATNNKLTADASTSTTTFDIEVSAGSTSNYNAPANKTITVNVVNKAAAGVSIASVPASKTYGDADFTLTATKTAPNSGTWSWSSSDSGILEIVSGANTATPTIKVKKADSTGATLTVTYTSATHYGTFTTGNIAVAQKDVTITGLGAENKVYDGNDTVTITGTPVVAGKVGSDDVTVTGGTATFDNKDVGAGKTVTFSGYSLSGAAAGNYNLTAQPANVTAEITAREVTITNGITATNRPYEKNNTTVNLNKSTLTFTNLVAGETLDANVPTTGTVDNANVGTGKNVTYSGVTLINGTGMASNYKLVGLPTVTVNITPAATPAKPTGLTGVKGNALSTVTLPVGWTWVNGSTVMNTVGSHNFKANYNDAAGNYASATDVDVTVNVMNKTDVSGKISFNDGTLVYTGAGQRYETASISGITAGTGVTWTYGYTAGTGTLDGGLPKTVGTYTVTVTYEDSLNYGTKSVTLTITQATPTGAPKFTKITSSGKTLGDAALVKTVSGPGDGFSVAGTVEWVDGSGTALADSTSVEANKSYGWKFTPTDSNYKSISGSVVVYTVRRVSHSGGAAADSAAAAAAQPTVYSGSRGESVKTLQEKLNAKGFNAGSVDGIFGKNTRAAVMAFQKANGLAADGIVGKLTWAKLYDTTAALPAASTTAGTQPMVYRGSRGDAVRRLQELLNKKGFDCGAVDGIFGSKTYAAVMAFQKANGLSADGIAGPLTWGKLG